MSAEVSQNAREAAAGVYTVLGRHLIARLVRDGKSFNDPFVEAFARFEAEIRAEANPGADALVGLDPELVQRVVHVAQGSSARDRFVRQANLTGYDWRRLAAALSAIDEGRGEK